MRPISFLLAATLALASAGPALAGTTNVEQVQLDEAHQQIVIRADGPLTVRTSTLDHPDRLVIDLPGTHFARSFQQLAGLAGTSVSRVRVAQFKSTVTRVVLDLSKLTAYKPIVQGTDVYIPLKGGSPVPLAALAPKATVAPTINAVDYAQGGFVIHMSPRAPYWSHAVSTGACRYMLVFPRTHLASGLDGLNKTVNAAGIARYELHQSGDDARLVIETSKAPDFRLKPSESGWSLMSDQATVPEAHATAAPRAETPKQEAHARPAPKPKPKEDAHALKPMPAPPEAPLTLRHSGRQWQLTITGDHTFHYRTTAVGDDRLHVDLFGAHVSLPRDSVYIDNGLIARVRMGAGPGGATRLTIDLDQPVRHLSRLLPGGRSLVLSLSRLNKERVTVDPGHGGTDDGAVGTKGVKEKDVTLAIAKRLSRLMESNGMSVQMTRMKDIEILLRPRVEAANRNDSDVFVSIHCNSMGAVHGVKGIETYYYTDQSYALAKAIHQHLVAALKQPDRGVRKNNFYVVHHTTMPAALVEVGYLSNPEDEANLNSPQYQQKAAEAIYAGIKDFIKNRKAKS